MADSPKVDIMQKVLLFTSRDVNIGRCIETHSKGPCTDTCISNMENNNFVLPFSIRLGFGVFAYVGYIWNWDLFWSVLSGISV